MTTIVYNHANKSVGIDSRVTDNYGKILSDTHNKTYHTKKGSYFGAGVVTDVEKLVAAHKSQTQLDDDEFLEATVIFKCNKTNKVSLISHDLTECELRWSAGFGSGGDFALAALDFGCTTKEAVEYASTRDAHSGGTVNVYE